jgi:UDP-glucose:(glucosyl)LPS beta-1,3-glucosyltransferase
MSQLVVSVIVPAYNVENFISDCIKSIQRQTFKQWEAIIVDDGSSDHSVEVIKSLIKEDQRFRLVSQANGGVSKARNTGILNACGKYLAFLDGDDMWEPTFLEEMLAAITSHEVNMAYCGYTHLYTGGLKRKFSYPYVSGAILPDVINGKTQIHVGAMLVQKSLIDNLGLLFTEGCLVGQDQEFIWKLVSRATVQSVPKELMLYRIRSGSAITAKWNWQKHIHAYYGFKRAAEYILKQPELVYDKDFIKQMLFERIAFKLYKIIWRMIKNGYTEEARQLLTNSECNSYLIYMNKQPLNLVDKIKYQMVLSKSNIWWRIAKAF